MILALDLQVAWVILAGGYGFFSIYYDAPLGEHRTEAVVILGLTLAVLVLTFIRARAFAAPIRQWVRVRHEIGTTDASKMVRHDPVLATRAWETAVGLPMQVAVRESRWPFLVIACPAVIAAVIILGLNPFAAVPMMFGCVMLIAYGGVLHYFALESSMRPVLKDINRLHAPWARTDIQVLPLRYKLIGSLPMMNIITGLVVAALSSAESGGGGAGLGTDVLIVIGASFAVSLIVTVMLSSSIMRPLNDLEEGIEAVRRGRYHVTVPVTTPDEFGDLSAAFNQMSKGLAEREKMRDTFGTYLDSGVAEHVLSNPGADGVEVEVSLLFCDVRGFTTFAASSEAPAVVARLNQLFEAVVPIIGGHGGHVNKFVGDGLLAVFGAPEVYPDHAERAVRCAIAMAQRVNHGGSGLFTVGIGVNSGRVVAGSIGGAGRLEYSVIGDAVNVAARVEAATRDLDDEVLITDESRRSVGTAIDLVNRGKIELRGKAEPIEVWAPVVETAEIHLPANVKIG